MKKIECLAPAGTLEALRAAIMGGADAIYCGGSQFGARAFAGNFNHDEMIEAIHLCHLWDVKLYVTMNTLLYEDEIKDAMKEVAFYYQIGVDALIIQDLGLFDCVRFTYPDFELHCSTQMHIHNAPGVQIMKDLGASRVVLARETPIEVIQDCCRLGIEIEVFSYGALCVSYSGQCLMSSLLQNRSGNRGACAQYCRMQYNLYNEDHRETISSVDKYLLSPKDLNALDYLDQLIEAGVTSLKIEGRMKRPEYVYLVTKTFREAIDAYYEGKKYQVTKERLDELKLMFNRGFTLGHLFHTNGKSLLNMNRPNHVGLPLGKVVMANRDGFTVKLEDELNQQDGLRILDEKEDLGYIANMIYVNDRLVNHASKGELVTFKDKRFVEVGSIVLKTTDSKLIGKLETFECVRKVDITIRVEAKVDFPMVLVLSDGTHTIEAKSEMIAQKPIKAPIEKERLFEQLLKLNDTAYQCASIQGNIEPFFMPLKQINELRRVAIEQLNSIRENDKQRITIPYIMKNYMLNSTFNQDWIEINKEEQIQNTNYIQCTSNPILLDKYPNLYPLSSVINESGQYLEDKTHVISEIGGLSVNDKPYATHHFNVTNSYALEFLYKQGIQCVELSQECSIEQIQLCTSEFEHRTGFKAQIAIFAYGRRDLMTSKTCVVNNLCKDGSKKNCALCKTQSYSLVDIKNNHYPLFGDTNCIQHILESEPYQVSNTNRYPMVLRFTIENEFETKEACENNHL
ncbi:U32 family peptidase [Anaerorhabdus sp.]|uniref:U32 family peptidase n=1 Tax=Anaerorhabdus sp. TaxID=1872524 RepID=UPI002FC7157E